MTFQSSLITILLATTLSSVSFAETSAEDVKRAAAAFDQGRSAYRAESYGEAAENFEAADGYAPSAKALRLAMLSRKEAGQLDRAATLAALGVDKYSTDDAMVTDGKKLLDEAAPSLGRVEVGCGDETGELLLDGKLVHGKCAGSRILFVTPGSHQLTASWSKGRTETESISLDAGASGQVSFVTPPVPAEPDVKPVSSAGSATPVGGEEENKGGWSPVVFWTGAGLTAAGVGASIFLGLKAINEPGKQKVIDQCQATGTDCPLYKEGVQNQTMASIAIGATAAVGAFTIVSLFLTDFSGDKKEPVVEAGRVRFTPVIGFGDGATIGAHGSF